MLPEEHLIDMAVTEEEAGAQDAPRAVAGAEEVPGEAAEPAGPRYPYGLRLTLTENEIEKLGIFPGELGLDQEVDVQAKARVKSIEERAAEGGAPGASAYVELQITRMQVDTAPTFDEAWDEALAEEPLEPEPGFIP